MLFTPSSAALIGPYDLADFTLINSFATDGYEMVMPEGHLALTGGNSGSGLPGTTHFVISAPIAGVVHVNFWWESLDLPGYDIGGWLLDGVFTPVADTNGDSGTLSLSVNAGQIFGFRVETLDNSGEPGVLFITNVTDPTAVPEPGTFGFIVVGLVLATAIRQGRRPSSRVIRPRAGILLGIATAGLTAVHGAAQTQISYTGQTVTGQLVLVRTVNVLAKARSAPAAMLSQTNFRSAMFLVDAAKQQEKFPAHSSRRLHPATPLKPGEPSVDAGRPKRAALGAKTLSVSYTSPFSILSSPPMVTTPVAEASATLSFAGLSHYDQRNAGGGNQFSIEPPSPNIAVANGYVLQGVNNALQVFTTSGTPLLPRVLSSNEWFGLPPAIDRTTDINGVYPTDMRVYYDSSVSRWFVLQQAQDNDAAGNPLNSSHVYLAVSQSSDPIGTYNIYIMDTTDPANTGCPCVADYPQIGADQYGFYISTNEYHAASYTFVNAQIHAISKSSLAAGAATPVTYRFKIPFTTGFEFAIQPASTPPGASPFLGSGGLEYFVSTMGRFAVGSEMAIWAMYNTSSLGTANPNLFLTQRTVPTLAYSFPDVATQRPGPLPYGSQVGGRLAVLDGGDTRILSLYYAGGRLFTTLSTNFIDENGRYVVGVAYAIFSPTFRAGVLTAPVLRQAYVGVKNNHLLRPSLAVDSRGRGAIAFTLVGPDYYPSVAYILIDTASTIGPVQIAGRGSFPEDGFTGYEGTGVARWGDYSAAVATAEGDIWMAAQYIPDTPRTEFANWGTFLMRRKP